ncbi:MAG: GNAT family N-acetyltransferase [Planctomycetes bacterium]|nr:GNAT family N-acetyltransferase [Planctomycetota bacterium]
MEAKVRIRIATTEDAEALCEAMRAFLAELDGSDTGLDVDSEVALATDLLAGDQHVVLLAESDKPIGFITAAETSALHAGGRYAVIDEFYVVPEMRSKGVGKALLEELADIAKDRGWRRFELTTTAQSGLAERALVFYEREGFERIGPRLKRLL